ncbi:hypothetical protein ONZ45_g12826 [Pleurotus djamor]|nr:hypothetical protein ONZ45_g12826 [Pleurotus djamor]
MRIAAGRRTKAPSPADTPPLDRPLSMNIPLDVADTILTHLRHAGGDTAFRASLVSKDWLYLSRRLVVKTLRIMEQGDLRILEDLLASSYSTIDQSTTGLTFLPADYTEKANSPVEEVSQGSYPRFSKLISSPRLCRLDLDGLSPLWRVNGDKITFLSAVTPTLTNITTLILRSLKFSCIAELTALLENTPSLRHLELLQVYWYKLGEYDVMPPPNARLAERLRVLRTRSISAEEFVDWLLMNDTALEITELDLGMVDRTTCKDICQRITRTSLRALYIHAFPDAYDLAEFSNLEVLSITIRAPDECRQAIEALKRVASPHIQTIRYDVQTRYFHWETQFFEIFEWKELESILEEERFQWLQSLEFSFESGYDMELAVKQIEVRSSDLHEKGLVYLSESSSDK